MDTNASKQINTQTPDLVTLAKSFFTEALVSKVSGFVNQDSSKTSGVITTAIPVILAGLFSKSSDQTGASQIFNFIKQSGFGSSTLSNFTSAFSGNQDSQKLLGQGEQILSMLFGSKTSMVSSLLSRISGNSSSATSSILALVAPAVMGLIGKQMSDSNVTSASAMSQLFSSQKGIVEKLLPAGFGSLLSGGAAMNLAAAGGASMLKKFAPMALVALIGGALFWFSKNKTTPTVEVNTQPVVDAAKEIATGTSQAVGTVAGFLKKSLPNGVELSFPELSLETKLLDFINDASKPVDKTTWFTMDRITFDTGSVNLQASSQEQLKNIEAIMKAYPNVSLKIGGYTDNTGDAQANMKLSQARAETVMKDLVSRGVGETRLAAEGYGSQHPVADNATEEGRAQNRRIDVRVTQK